MDYSFSIRCAVDHNGKQLYNDDFKGTFTALINKDFFMQNIEKFKPAVPRSYLILLSGIVWECVGIMLISFSYNWLSAVSDIEVYLFSGLGISAALIIHHFGFLKIVDKNLRRILQKSGKQCLFSFFPFKSYLTILIMVSIGIILRSSQIPKKYLAVLYTGIGLALILSSIRYWRIFIREIKK